MNDMISLPVLFIFTLLLLMVLKIGTFCEPVLNIYQYLVTLSRSAKDMNIEKIQKKRVHEQIVHKIEEMLLKRELVVGDRLPSERELAKKFNVSRNAVRQALAVLKEKELIEIRIGDGTYAKSSPKTPIVASLADLLNKHRKEIVDPIEVRQLIEPQIASLAAERASEQDIEELENLIAEHRKLLQTREFLTPEEDEEFHCKIALATGNSILPKIITTTFTHVDKSRFVSLSNKKSPKLSLEGHQKIVNAIRMRDPEGAFEAMLQHLEDIRKLIISNYVEK